MTMGKAIGRDKAASSDSRLTRLQPWRLAGLANKACWRLIIYDGIPFFAMTLGCNDTSSRAHNDLNSVGPQSRLMNGDSGCTIPCKR
jgi:hypothetical protein